jgi:argininosuccinate lyase
VAIEHARAIGSKALGQAHAIALAVHNTPFGDIVDTEDDLQPLVWTMFRDATRTVRLVAAALQTATFDAARLEARAGEGGTTTSELADTLVREHGLAFKTAHAITARVLRVRAQHPDARASETLAAVAFELLGKPIVYTEERLGEILSPRYFVAIRRTAGGPAPAETARAVTAIAAGAGRRSRVAGHTPPRPRCRAARDWRSAPRRSDPAARTAGGTETVAWQPQAAKLRREASALSRCASS